MTGSRWRVAQWARTLRVMCFNLRFESEADLAAIAAGMAADDDVHAEPAAAPSHSVAPVPAG